MVQRLPPLNQTRTKRRHSGPTEGPPDDNQRTRNIPNRESTRWAFRAGCTVAQATRHRARVQKDKCSRFRGFLQRIFDTFSQRLSVQASFPRIHRSRRRTLQAHAEPHFAFRPFGAVRASRRRIRQLPASPRRVVLPLIQVLSPLPIPRNRSGTVARRYNYQRAFRRVSKSAPRHSFLKKASG